VARWAPEIPGLRTTLRKPFALVGLVLGNDPHRDGLQALETRRGLEMRALLAAVQGHPALGTVALEVRAAGKGRSAVVTPGGDNRLHQARQPGPGDVDGGARASRTLFRLARAVLAAGVHVAPLFVFTIVFHGRIHDLLRGSVSVLDQWACFTTTRPASDRFEPAHSREAGRTQLTAKVRRDCAGSRCAGERQVRKPARTNYTLPHRFNEYQGPKG
jgi:hypothetical protein